MANDQDTKRSARVAKQFASKGDLVPKQVSFTELAPGAYAYTA